MTHLLEKNTPFNFSEDCILAFQTLKKKLTEALILIAPNWDQPFEIMCDASDNAIGAVLGERVEKHFRPIHYASKIMTEAETNYTTTEKEMLAILSDLKKAQVQKGSKRNQETKPGSRYSRRTKSKVLILTRFQAISSRPAPSVVQTIFASPRALNDRETSQQASLQELIRYETQLVVAVLVSVANSFGRKENTN
ncbi:reverse transcriptase domain-containing protein [Tanacetum coccineum]